MNNPLLFHEKKKFSIKTAEIRNAAHIIVKVFAEITHSMLYICLQPVPFSALENPSRIARLKLNSLLFIFVDTVRTFECNTILCRIMQPTYSITGWQNKRLAIKMSEVSENL